MRTLYPTLAATLIGTAVGMAAWLSGFSGVVWPAHPGWAGFLMTLVTTVAVQIYWSRDPRDRDARAAPLGRSASIRARDEKRD
jgi:hypothetical protein